jgi:radical SAM superfamily enzyme YgiQ (UPF0313 family)
MRIWLVTPPMTQLNTPYPAIAYLAGFLKTQNLGDLLCTDLSLELGLKILSGAGLKELLKPGLSKVKKPDKNSKVLFDFIRKNADEIILKIDAVVEFLQGSNPTLAYRIVSQNFLPIGPRALKAFEPELDNLGWGFGTLGLQDKAKFLCTLFVGDIADYIQTFVDPRFQLARYGEKLAASQPSFDPLYKALNSNKKTILDEWIDSMVDTHLAGHRPDFVVVTAPFPGNAYGAFRVANAIKKNHPEIKTVLGGGWVNTELRGLSDVRVFESFDFVCLDDGERPLLQILKNLPRSELVRTFCLEQGKVKFFNSTQYDNFPQSKTGTPDYSQLRLDRYISLLEMLNPMHRMWSDLRWNKLTVAHGCYWKKCTFCDLSLDYISRYEQTPTDTLIQKIQDIIQQTGTTGFHFVDEAAPPAALKAMAEKLIEKKIQITWWTNIRFEKSFDSDLCQLLAKSGCVAVTGGLEVASDRLLKLMDKGVTVEQVAKVTQAFSDAGVMVHAYLMYGFPTQTHEETLEALENVRRLFESGSIQSAFWHRFSATAHSPIGMNPKKYSLKILQQPKGQFGHNDLDFVDLKGDDPSLMTEGLNRALYNYMNGLGFEKPVSEWFENANQ